MRLRELRKLVEQLAGGGGGALIAEDLAAVEVPGVSPVDSAGWSLSPEFLPLGPIHLEARPYVVIWTAQQIGDDVAADVANFSGYTVEPGGVESAFGFGGVPVAPDWPSSMWQGMGNLNPGLSAICPLGPTELYLLVAASDQTGAAPPSAPVTVRNRHIGVLPI